MEPEKNLLRNLSKNLRALRGPKSQAEFSEELGVAKGTVHAIETQRVSIRLDTLEVICGSLGIPPQAILSDDMDTMDLGMLAHVLRRTEWFLKLTPESQQAYIQWLRHTADLLVRLAGQNREQER